jgi:hypothetical protein
MYIGFGEENYPMLLFSLKRAHVLQRNGPLKSHTETGFSGMIGPSIYKNHFVANPDPCPACRIYTVQERANPVRWPPKAQSC